MTYRPSTKSLGPNEGTVRHCVCLGNAAGYCRSKGEPIANSRIPKWLKYRAATFAPAGRPYCVMTSQI